MSILSLAAEGVAESKPVGDPHIQIFGSTAVVPALAAQSGQDRKGISIERNVETQSNRIRRPQPDNQPGAFASGHAARIVGL
jgi:hypothetical protein